MTMMTHAQKMMTDTATVEMATWPEEARRNVRTQEKALELCQAERAHYASIVEENASDWEEQEFTRGQLEALGIENHKLKAECEALRARLARERNRASRDSDARHPTPLESDVTA